MQNKLPTSVGLVLNLLLKMYAGVVLIGAAVGVTMVSAAQLLAGKTALKNADDIYETARTGLTNAYAVYTPALEAFTSWLGVARSVLAGRLGQRWSALWAEAGWINNTTSIPTTVEGKIALGNKLVTFFTNHPEYQVADMQLTADVASDLTESVTAAQKAVATAKTTMKDAENVLKPAMVVAQDLMSTLLANLKKKLGPNDGRWLTFGLNMPGTSATPGKVQGVSVSMDETGAIMVRWDEEALATRYRGRMMILGIDTKYRLVFSGVELMGQIADIEPGVTVQIIVQAVNDNSQGVASEPVIFTVPPVVSAPAAKVISETAVAPNGNSNGNGHGKASHAVSRLS